MHFVSAPSLCFHASRCSRAKPRTAVPAEASPDVDFTKIFRSSFQCRLIFSTFSDVADQVTLSRRQTAQELLRRGSYVVCDFICLQRWCRSCWTNWCGMERSTCRNSARRRSTLPTRHGLRRLSALSVLFTFVGLLSGLFPYLLVFVVAQGTFVSRCRPADQRS